MNNFFDREPGDRRPTEQEQRDIEAQEWDSDRDYAEGGDDE